MKDDELQKLIGELREITGKIKKERPILPKTLLDAMKCILKVYGGTLKIKDIKLEKIFLILRSLGLFDFKTHIVIHTYGPICVELENEKKRWKRDRSNDIKYSPMRDLGIVESVYSSDDIKGKYSLGETEEIYLKKIINRIRETDDHIRLSYYFLWGRFSSKLTFQEFNKESAMHHTLIHRYKIYRQKLYGTRGRISDRYAVPKIDRFSKNLDYTDIRPIPIKEIDCDDIERLLIDMSSSGGEDLKTTNPGFVYLETINMVYRLRGKMLKSEDIRDLTTTYISHKRLSKSSSKEHHETEIKRILNDYKNTLDKLEKYGFIGKEGVYYYLTGESFLDKKGNTLELKERDKKFYEGLLDRRKKIHQ